MVFGTKNLVFGSKQMVFDGFGCPRSALRVAFDVFRLRALVRDLTLATGQAGNRQVLASKVWV